MAAFCRLSEVVDRHLSSCVSWPYPGMGGYDAEVLDSNEVAEVEYINSELALVRSRKLELSLTSLGHRRDLQGLGSISQAVAFVFLLSHHCASESSRGITSGCRITMSFPFRHQRSIAGLIHLSADTTMDSIFGAEALRTTKRFLSPNVSLGSRYICRVNN